MASGDAGETIGILTGEKRKIENGSANQELQNDLESHRTVGDPPEYDKRVEPAQGESKNGDDSGPQFGLFEWSNDVSGD